MATLYEKYAPRDITEFARTLIEETDNSFLTTLFPNQTQNSNYATWTENGVGGKNKATYRSFGAETDFGSLYSGSEGSMRLAPLGLKMPYSEDDAVAVQEGMADEQEIIDQLTVEVTQAVINTLNRMRADAFVNASYGMPMSGVPLADGSRAEIPVTFQRDPRLVTTAPELWTDRTADLIEQIANFIQAGEDVTGKRATTLVTSTRVFSTMIRSGSMASYAGVSGETNLVTQAAIQGTLAAFGLPQITVFDDVDVDGNRYFPDDRIFLLRPDEVGHTVWGPTTAARNPKYRIGRAPGIFVGAYEEQDADTKFVRSDASALPILENPNNIVSVKVV